MLYYTSDLHLGHKNIIDYEHRPFKDVDDMTEGLIERWNNKVKSDTDITFILGDFAFRNQYMNKAKILECFKRLNGYKYLVPGNHENYLTKDFIEEISIDDNNTWIMNSLTEIVDDYRIVILCHYPIEEWNGKYRGTYHVHGHIHSQDIIHNIPKRFNCGVDVRNYEPVTLDEMIDAARK